MNRYAIENLFGIEGLNIAWYARRCSSVFRYYTFNCGGTQKSDEICRRQRFSLRRSPLRYRNDSRYGNRYVALGSIKHSLCQFAVRNRAALLFLRKYTAHFFQTDGRRHCRINHFAVTVTPATLIKDQNFSNHFPVSYKKAQRHRVLNLCGVVLLSIGHFLKASLCEPAFCAALSGGAARMDLESK